MALSSYQKVGYGTVEIGINGIESFLRLYLLIFLTDRFGMDPHLAGYAIGGAIFWDALIDPLMGFISDRTQSRFGSRLPYIFSGSFLLSVSSVILFCEPTLTTQASKFIFLLVTYMLLNSAMTMIAIPHLALGGDLSSEPAERTTIYAWRMLFSIFGLILGTAIPGALRLYNPFSMSPDLSTAIIIVLVLVVATAITIHSTFPLRKIEVKQLVAFHFSWRGVFRYTEINLLLGAFFVATLGQGLNATLALYYYRYFLELSEGELQTVLGVLMIVLCLSLPFWVYFSKIFPKKNLIGAGIIILGVMGSFAYPLFPKRQIIYPCIFAAVGGFCIGSVGILESFLVDILEGLGLGQKSYGLFFGFWKLSAKVARSLAIVSAGSLLSWIHFTPNTSLTGSHANNLAMVFGPGVGILFILGGVLLFFIKIKPIADCQ